MFSLEHQQVHLPTNQTHIFHFKQVPLIYKHYASEIQYYYYYLLTDTEAIL